MHACKLKKQEAFEKCWAHSPLRAAARRIAIHQVSLLSHAACASMSTTTTTTRDRGDRYGPIEWAQLRIFERPSTARVLKEFARVVKSLTSSQLWISLYIGLAVSRRRFVCVSSSLKCVPQDTAYRHNKLSHLNRLKNVGR